MPVHDVSYHLTQQEAGLVHGPRSPFYTQWDTMDNTLRFPRPPMSIPTIPTRFHTHKYVPLVPSPFHSHGHKHAIQYMLFEQATSTQHTSYARILVEIVINTIGTVHTLLAGDVCISSANRRWNNANGANSHTLHTNGAAWHTHHWRDVDTQHLATDRDNTTRIFSSLFPHPQHMDTPHKTTLWYNIPPITL